MDKTKLSERDAAEIERSAAEADRLMQGEITPAEVDRYLDPPSDVIYPLEYAFHLLGDIRGKVVLDLGCGSGECLLPLAKRGGVVKGIDISAGLIDIARRRV